MTQGKIYRADYSTAKDARVHQTRAAIRKAFLKLLDKKPLEQITVREIASAASVGYTTFFRHHTSKEALLNEIAATEIKHLIELALPVLGTIDTRNAALAMCGYVAEHRALWSTLLTGGASNVLREEFIRLSLQVAASWNGNNKRLPPELGVILVTSGTIELLAWWLKQKNPIAVEELAIIFDKTVVSPVVSDW
ncbi:MULTISPECIES: TetR/AcrR family transcriptional regulator [unclassified Ketobacter]|jgi:AcrR family transcriptional regulator|uniref:TetR/AcrR family transcriptional regulator n=1 Tax=unclassified Ketobacter TaxID=2639109 RepID=UPI000C96C6FF|nr:MULTISPECIES: TetR/AcrR family transcriptional regulator [unclassified Ketobacter]MAR91010.1 TetR family transcriptional regulator [Pseudomonadales bacterium]MEC8810495.1 TetR/AcrR family transcriptional regulator [Pseudomonadota bacterium]HAG94453.1 TetR/AcrR family transcriptional regulator [Gammaproteobacteria bacterium]RLT90202.1 MAG: TetR/AcrR family transcriptional regulator [Ketobacter sp. GenoA1]RLT93601.1 MAG: TetR/AcrR family transcriptional regulator [Ketobacter sp.]|tara:strand:- start:10240 stop:10821 length:582 start_codon:yes stop_codon:yes gene_type:complete